MDLLDSCRRKRHVAVYEQIGAISSGEADAMIALAIRLRKKVAQWLREKHRGLFGK